MNDFLQHKDFKANTMKKHLKSIKQLDEENANPLNKENITITKLKQYTLIIQQTLIKTISKIRTYKSLGNVKLNIYLKR